MKLDLNQYEQSVAVGFWRMGVELVVIAAILDCRVFSVEKAIHDRKIQIKHIGGMY